MADGTDVEMGLIEPGSVTVTSLRWSPPQRAVFAAFRPSFRNWSLRRAVGLMALGSTGLWLVITAVVKLAV